MHALYLTSVFLHIIAAMIWIGGMVLVAFAVMPEVRRLDSPVRQTFLWHFVGRLRVLMWSAYAVAGLTGALNLWFRGIGVEHFLRTEWLASSSGRVIGAKTALYVLSGLVALVHERAPGVRAARWGGRAVLVLGLIMVFLAVRIVRGA